MYAKFVMGCFSLGKLAQLWQDLRESERGSPQRKEIQAEINKVERWMIAKGYKTDGETKWNDNEKESNRYPWHVDTIFFEDLWMVKQYNETGVNYNPDKSVHNCVEC